MMSPWSVIGLSAQEIFDEVIVAPRRAYPPLPDLRVVERPGWLQIITPSIKTGGLNEVIWSRLHEHNADQVIDVTIAEYRALGLEFRWDAVLVLDPARGAGELHAAHRRQEDRPAAQRDPSRRTRRGGRDLHHLIIEPARRRRCRWCEH
jgi:hypothetical protein